MKRLLAVALTVAFAASATAGCAGAGDDAGSDSASGRAADSSTVSVVTTIFPLFDWCREIAAGADGIDIVMLLDNGTDLHSYQPTVDDMASISECDLFVFVGGVSDAWAEDATGDASGQGRVDLSMMEVLDDDVLAEEDPSMQADAASDDAADDDEADEHVWLSLSNAQVLCSAIADALGEVDPANAELFASNAEAYCAELADLDSRYAETVDAADIDTLVFCDRFPFLYLIDDYGLSYYAAFPGCSAEAEASFETVAHLAERIDELSLSHVVTIEGSDASIADTVIESTESKDAEVVEMDSMQSVTAADVDAGATYLDAMERNLDVLAEALS